MSHDNLHEPSPTQSREVETLKGHLEVEERGAILIVGVDGGPHALFGPQIANQLFLIADQSKDAQDLMIEYLAATDATGELPLYNPDTYARAVESGREPGGRSGDGA